MSWGHIEILSRTPVCILKHLSPWPQNYTWRSSQIFVGVGISQNTLKNDISIHNWTSNNICSIRYTQYVYFVSWTLRKWLYLRPQNSTRSRPPSADDFLCCFGVLNTVISWKSKIKSTHIEYISWDIFFRGPIMY